MNKTGKRVLVTGASGFIGRELCRQLTERGYQLNTYNRNNHSDIPIAESASTNTFYGDIGDPGQLSQAMEGVGLVFHLAGLAHVGGAKKATLKRVNVQGTAAVLKAAQVAGVRKFLYFSSSLAHAAEIGDRSVTPYGESKLLAEQLVRQAGQKSAIEVCILRPVNVYGAGMKGNISTMIRLIAKGKLPPLPVLNNKLSLIGVKDLCSAAILCAESAKSSGRTYFVTDGIAYRINAIEQAIYAALGRQKPRWHTPRVILFAAAVMAGLLTALTRGKSQLGKRTYKNLVTDSVFSNAQLCDELGFRPATSFYAELPSILQSMPTAQKAAAAKDQHAKFTDQQ